MQYRTGGYASVFIVVNWTENNLSHRIASHKSAFVTSLISCNVIHCDKPLTQKMLHANMTNGLCSWDYCSTILFEAWRHFPFTFLCGPSMRFYHRPSFSIISNPSRRSLLDVTHSMSFCLFSIPFVVLSMHAVNAGCPAFPFSTCHIII